MVRLPRCWVGALGVSSRHSDPCCSWHSLFINCAIFHHPVRFANRHDLVAVCGERGGWQSARSSAAAHEGSDRVAYISVWGCVFADVRRGLYRQSRGYDFPGWANRSRRDLADRSSLATKTSLAEPSQLICSCWNIAISPTTLLRGAQAK